MGARALQGLGCSPSHHPQGYANPGQIAGGIHIRLFARTFIVADAADPDTRVAFVNMDAGKAGRRRGQLGPGVSQLSACLRRQQPA